MLESPRGGVRPHGAAGPAARGHACGSRGRVGSGAYPVRVTTSEDALETLVDTWLTLPDVAERVGLDVGKVRRMLQERRLVGVRRGDPRVLSVPERFLVPARTPADRDAAATGEWIPLPWLQGTLTVLADAGFSDAEAIVWLFTPDETLPGSPIDALRAGQKTEVRRRAQAEL